MTSPVVLWGRINIGSYIFATCDMHLSQSTSLFWFYEDSNRNFFILSNIYVLSQGHLQLIVIELRKSIILYFTVIYCKAIFRFYPWPKIVPSSSMLVNLGVRCIGSMQSGLLRAAHWPSYIHGSTRREVLHVFKQIHRALRRIPEPLASSQLRKWATACFIRYKYVTNPHRIKALIRVARGDLELCLKAAELQPKPLRQCLDLAYGTYRVRELPSRKLCGGPRSIDIKDLVVRLNNVKPPPCRSFASHIATAKIPLEQQAHDYFILCYFLKKGRIFTGRNRRKLEIDPPMPHTVLGDVVALSRQKNVLLRNYDRLLRDAPTPVHPETLEHIHKSMDKRELPRKMRRRLKDCARSYWTLSSKGFTKII